VNGCDATSQVSIIHTFKVSVLNKFSELSLLREHSDGFYEVLVRVTVISDPVSHLGNNIEGPEVVELFKSWKRYIREF